MPQISEQELEEYIFNNYEALFKVIETNPNEEGKDIETVILPKKILRQVCLGEYGRIDLLVIYEDSISVIELKQGNIDYNAVGQVSRYITGLKRLFKNPPFFIKGVVIGNEIGSGDVCYVLNHTFSIDLWTYKLDLSKGIEFDKDHAGYYLIKEGFEEKGCKELVKTVKENIKEFKIDFTEIPF